jgi:hypothetical protein
MKKAFFVIVFVLLATAVFGQQNVVGVVRNDLVKTSAGEYIVAFVYDGKNHGQKWVNLYTSEEFNGKSSVPTNQHWECINFIFRNYFSTHTRGDTFHFMLFDRRSDIYDGFVFICEFTSATQYNYWFFYLPSPL